MKTYLITTGMLFALIALGAQPNPPLQADAVLAYSRTGAAYHPILKRVDEFFSSALPEALETRGERASKVLDLDDAVGQAVGALKERGFTSPYLKAFVVARVNPLRFQKGAKASFDDTLV